MTKLRLIRGSEVSSYLSCHKSWKLRWVDRLVKKTPDKKLFFGTLFHKHMEHLYTSGNIPDAYDRTNQWLRQQDVSDMDALEYQDLMELFHEVTSYYEDVYANDDLSRFNVIATELRFAIPLYQDTESDSPLDFAYEGTIDLIYEEEGKLKFMDHKTVSSIDRYVNNAVLDRQISRYWFALEALCSGFGYIRYGEHWIPVKESYLADLLSDFEGPDEFVYNITKKEAPKPPKALKKDGFSVAKNQNTTYKLYVEALKREGFYWIDSSGTARWFNATSEEKYQPMLDYLAEQGNDKYLRRIPVHRSSAEAAASMEDFAKVAEEIMQLRYNIEHLPHLAERSLYYNITWDTPTYNPYYQLIAAELKGENVSMTLAALYTTEEYNPEDDFIEVDDVS